MNTKKEGEYYSEMVRRYKNKYRGKNLQEFCILEKVATQRCFIVYETNPIGSRRLKSHHQQSSCMAYIHWS